MELLKKLLRKPASCIALFVIVMVCLVAVFAYIIAPDNTPYANTMIIELGAKPPGFTKQFLRIPKNQEHDEGSVLRKLWMGAPARCSFSPINAFLFRDTVLVVQHYIDDGISDTITYAVAKLVPPSFLSKPLALQQVYIKNNNIIKRTFWLGTDRYGRDIFSRLIIGSRVTLSIGLMAVALSLSIGIMLGALAGYYGGITDSIITWFINIIYAIPTLLMVFAITFTIGKGLTEVFVAIGLSIWTGAARLVRGQVLVIRELEYVTAARALGLGNLRIIFRHILPNLTGTLIVVAAGNFATAILAEAGLSFLGFGVQPPEPSWGLMIKEHYNFLLAGNPMPALIPGIAIMLLVYAFNILGNALRDVVN